MGDEKESRWNVPSQVGKLWIQTMSRGIIQSQEIVHSSVLLLCVSWHAEIVDVEGAFLKGLFGQNENVYMEVPKGFSGLYSVMILL